MIPPIRANRESPGRVSEPSIRALADEVLDTKAKIDSLETKQRNLLDQYAVLRARELGLEVGQRVEYATSSRNAPVPVIVEHFACFGPIPGAETMDERMGFRVRVCKLRKDGQPSAGSGARRFALAEHLRGGRDG